MKNKNSFIASALGAMLLLSANGAFAQSAYKEASNAFALYTQTGDIKNLDNARKQIDNIYKTRRDSSKTRVNVLRGMVLSSLAYADSARTIKLNADPIDLTYQTLDKIDQKDRAGYAGEINYINQNLAAALIHRANKSLQEQKFDAAFADFSKVDALDAKSGDVTYNLALLATKAGKPQDAIKYYGKIHEGGNMTAQQYIELANLYDQLDEKQQALSTLEEGRTKFPEDKSLLFLLIDKYAKNEAFDAIVPIIEQAIKLEPENIELNYLAGYANENANNIEIAKSYYSKVLELDPNNYESNLALGLINLETLLKEPSNQDIQELTIEYLLKANEIKPYDVNALKALAKYYKLIDDASQLDRVNLLLNQLTVK
jgi:tetratricopeptide (TPR) repeat protein